MSIKDEIADFRKDPASTAESHVEEQIDGTVRIDSKPPRSVADMQTEANGYDPTILFDEENDAKRIDGVSQPAPTREELLEMRSERYLEICDELAEERAAFEQDYAPSQDDDGQER